MRVEKTLAVVTRVVCGRHGLLVLVCMWFAFIGAAAAEDCHIDGRYVMGTVFEMTVCPNDNVREASPTTVVEEAFRLAKRLDALFTTYSSQGPVIRLLSLIHI